MNNSDNKSDIRKYIVWYYLMCLLQVPNLSHMGSCLKGDIEDITWLGRDGQFIFDS